MFGCVHLLTKQEFVAVCKFQGFQLLLRQPDSPCLVSGKFSKIPISLQVTPLTCRICALPATRLIRPHLGSDWPSAPSRDGHHLAWAGNRRIRWIPAMQRLAPSAPKIRRLLLALRQRRHPGGRVLRPCIGAVPGVGVARARCLGRRRPQGGGPRVLPNPPGVLDAIPINPLRLGLEVYAEANAGVVLPQPRVGPPG